MMKPPPIKLMKPPPIKTTPIVRQITFVEAVCYLIAWPLYYLIARPLYYLIALPLVIAWNVLLCVARISEDANS